MSAHEEERTVATERDAAEKNDGTVLGFSTEIFEEKITAKLEPLHALTHMMDRLVHGNSAREFTTASTIEAQFPSEIIATHRRSRNL